jgi:hypothetical protein
LALSPAWVTRMTGYKRYHGHSGTGQRLHDVTPELFEQSLDLIPEPYASMVFVAVWNSLRVSELIGLKWDDVGTDSLPVDEGCCRGDWNAPKSEASNARIGVERCVVDRINRLKQLTVNVKAGRAVRHYKVGRSDRPEDLVFQSVKTGAPMHDNNILSRHIVIVILVSNFWRK